MRGKKVSFVVPGWTTGRKRVGTGGRRTEKYILKDNRLLRKSAEIVDCDARGRLLFYACPGEVHVEKEKEYAETNDRRLEAKGRKVSPSGQETK